MRGMAIFRYFLVFVLIYLRSLNNQLVTDDDSLFYGSKIIILSSILYVHLMAHLAPLSSPWTPMPVRLETKQEEKSLGGLRHLIILILSEKHLSILVKLIVLVVVCPHPPNIWR